MITTIANSADEEDRSLNALLLRRLATALLLSIMVAAGSTGCSKQAQATPDSGTPMGGAAELAEWQILDVASKRVVSFEALMERMVAADVVYLGEEHHNRHHIDAATRVIAGLVDRGRHPVLAIEMFGWDGQEAVTRYVANGELDRERFLKESKWKQNWGGDFGEYEPLIEIARRSDLEILALNPPRALVRKVARQGLSRAMEDAAMARWGMQGETVVDDPAYRAVIMDQLRQCHGGMPDEAYERIYEASMFRDEGMAKALASRLQALPESAGPIVSYTGGGHIQHRTPVPDRVERRSEKSIRQVTVYMQSLQREHPEYTEDLLRNRIADYVWLTPIGDHGPPVRCGK